MQQNGFMKWMETKALPNAREYGFFKAGIFVTLFFSMLVTVGVEWDVGDISPYAELKIAVGVLALFSALAVRAGKEYWEKNIPPLKRQAVYYMAALLCTTATASVALVMLVLCYGFKFMR